MRKTLLASILAAAGLFVAASAQGSGPAFIELAQAAAKEAAPPTRYAVLNIVQPKSAETIHDNTGKVSVEVALQPPLNTKAGHRLRVVLDGSLHPGSWSTTRFSLQQVDRGTHQLEVIVMDSADRELARSAATEFYMWQASRLFRQRSPQ